MLLLILLFLDFVTLRLACVQFGLATTAGFTLSLSVSGCLLCGYSYLRLLRANEQLNRICIDGLPLDRKLLQIYEARGTLMIVFLFLYPGLLSDIFALFLILPKFRDNYYCELLSVLHIKARRDGKTLEQLIAPRSS